MWEGNTNVHDVMDKEYLKNEFLKWKYFGKDSLGRKMLGHFIKNSGIVSPKILDIPCGNCVTYEVLKELDFNFTYYGADLTDKMLEVSKELYPELEGRLTSTYIQKTPYKDCEFDIVIARHIFEHIPDYKQAIEEVLRITKHSAYLVFFIQPTDDPTEIRKLWDEGRKGYYCMNRYFHGEIREIVSSYGKGFGFIDYPAISSNFYGDKENTTDYIFELVRNPNFARIKKKNTNLLYEVYKKDREEQLERYYKEQKEINSKIGTEV